MCRKQPLATQNNVGWQLIKAINTACILLWQRKAFVLFYHFSSISLWTKNQTIATSLTFVLSFCAWASNFPFSWNLNPRLDLEEACELQHRKYLLFLLTISQKAFGVITRHYLICSLSRMAKLIGLIILYMGIHKWLIRALFVIF